MLNTLLATKKKMSATFVQDTRVPITFLIAGPCTVTQIKRMEKDGYWAVQLGFGTKSTKNVSKPLQGHLRKISQNSEVKSQNKLPRYLREVRLDKEPEYKVGDTILASDIFSPGDTVAVTGTSKGKGFAGVVKRWHFAGGPKTHGQSDRHRAPGSIGQGTTPGRVYKGKHMAGRMGGDTVTVKNLKVVAVDAEHNEVAVSGAIPGANGGLISIKKIASGNLEELVEEAPEVQIQVEEEAETKEPDKAEVKQEESKAEVAEVAK